MKRASLLSILSIPFLLAGCGIAQGATTNNTPASTQNTMTTKPATVVKAKTTEPKSKPKPPVILSLGNTTPDAEKLNEQLAELGYLPVTYSNGSFQWKYSDTPQELKDIWKPNVYNTMTEGAVYQFESVEGLGVDGVAGSKVLATIQHAKTAPYPYSYVLVTKQQPETLRIWYGGKWVYSTLCNTGVYGATTEDGTFPIYLRYQSQTMIGQDLDGSTYVDPGIPYVSYFNGGDAVHGFIRSSYGYPQSLGCVELPFSAAKVAWGYMHYGTLVTVDG